MISCIFVGEQEDAVKLVRDAILAGVFNDLGSGSNVDINVLRKDGTVKVMRGYMTPNEVAPFRAQYQRPKALDVPAGATAVLSTRFEPAGVVVSDVQPMVL
jgi:20S proteasome subunit beta 2